LRPKRNEFQILNSTTDLQIKRFSTFNSTLLILNQEMSNLTHDHTFTTGSEAEIKHENTKSDLKTDSEVTQNGACDPKEEGTVSSDGPLGTNDDLIQKGKLLRLSEMVVTQTDRLSDLSRDVHILDVRLSELTSNTNTLEDRFSEFIIPLDAHKAQIFTFSQIFKSQSQKIVHLNKTIDEQSKLFINFSEEKEVKQNEIETLNRRIQEQEGRVGVLLQEKGSLSRAVEDLKKQVEQSSSKSRWGFF